jgi:transcriptional regulator GlxA family with amidase domain
MKGGGEELEKNCLEMAGVAGYSATELALLHGISVRQLQRNFKQTMSQSPKRWLKALRLEAARKLLQDGGSVKQAAFSFGYKHPHHFSRDFRNFFGISPSRARALQPVADLNSSSGKK